MKNILKLTLIVSAISLFSINTINAQESPKRPALPQMTAEQRADRRTDELKAKLKLDESQTAKVKEAILRFEGQRGESHDEMRKNREALDASLNGIFTPEQQTEYNEIQEAKKAQMKARRQEMHEKGESQQEDKTK